MSATSSRPDESSPPSELLHNKPEAQAKDLAPEAHFQYAPEALFQGRDDPDDPRLGEVCRRLAGQAVDMRQGQPVVLGFPCDEGVRRNHGRRGAAQAPNAIREQLYRLTSWDAPSETDLAKLGLIDWGNWYGGEDLEEAQHHLGEKVGQLLRADLTVILLGGGHETTFGHYRGYAHAGRVCGIINIDAHLDVRPYPHGAHSGSPFRQALQYPPQPLPAGGYVVIGAQRQGAARSHCDYVYAQGGRIRWLEECKGQEVVKVFAEELDRLANRFGSVLVSVDADAFREADVPGVSAPSPIGLDGTTWPEIALLAGCNPCVRSIDVVEINPAFDRDAQSARWAALGIRQFLVGLAKRPS